VLLQKKILTPIIIGEIIFQKYSKLKPNLFKGVKILEFNKPKIKKIKEIIIDHTLISSL
jgi:hypothetical protein